MDFVVVVEVKVYMPVFLSSWIIKPVKVNGVKLSIQETVGNVSPTNQIKSYLTNGQMKIL